MTIWVVLMGALVGTACGLVGNYLLLRRMALVGDAISHSILPGLVVAFMIFRTVNTPIMFAGALGAGLLTVAIIEFIQKQTRVKVDAAISIATARMAPTDSKALTTTSESAIISP